MAILFLDSKTRGVNFSDIFQNDNSLSHDYINPLINPAEVTHVSTFLHTYAHQQSVGFIQSGKFGIRFSLTNGINADWLYDQKTEMLNDFERLKKTLCETLTN